MSIKANYYTPSLLESSQKRILFYTKDLNGGIARFLENIIPLLQKENWQVSLICHQVSHHYCLSPEVIGAKINRQTNFSLINLWLNLMNLISLFWEIKKKQPVIIYSLDLYANVNCLMLKYFLPNKIYIQTTHANLSGYLSNRQHVFKKFIINTIKYLYRQSHLHLVPSHGLKKQLVNLLQIKSRQILVLPNFIDVKKIQTLASKTTNFKKNPRQINLITMARFDKQKNIESLFPVIAKNKNYHLFLLGAGPLIIKYRRIIAALKITSQITFLGWQDNPYCFLRQADIFLLLSYYEGFPFSLLEALAIGLPIITSDVDFGPREILAGGRYGILIKNTSPKNIQKAIHQALKTKKQLQLRQKRANDFDSSYIFPQYLRIFQKLIQ